MKFFVLALLVFGVVAGTHAQTTLPLPLSIPFDFENNQIYLRVGINGHEPVWFVVDSGASGCVIDTAVAKKLGLQTHGQKRSTGAGKGTYAVTFTDNVTYDLPGLHVTIPDSLVIDLSEQPAITGRDIAGILGYDFFARYVIAVDYDAAVMTLFNPADFSYRGTGTVIPFTLVKKTPHISVHVTVTDGPGVDREVLVDSGSEDAIDDDSLAGAPKRLEIVGGVGLGQEFRTTIGRARRLSIGPYVLDQPFGATGGVPLIGTEVLRRFYIIFDYARSRLILEPNRHLQDAFSFDASGLDLRWSPDSFLIHDVAKRSPAADSGLQAGDAIVSINGQPAKTFRLEQIQNFLTAAGKTLRLGVLRGNKHLDVSLTLRERL
jgi:aspartyl protease/PDZ domain-containing protein